MIPDRTPELRHLRLDLYRRRKPADAVERYESLLARSEPAAAPEHGSAPAGDRTRRRPGRRRPRRVVLAVGLVAAAAAGVAMATTAGDRAGRRDEGAAEPVVADGAYAVTDRAILDRLVVGGRPSSDAIVRAVQRSSMDQFAVWRGRTAGAAVDRGRGPLTSRYPAGSSPTLSARPVSIVVACERTVPYRWIVRGTTADRPRPHVLGTGSTQRCGRTPTAATFSLPVGTVVRGFEFSIADGTAWGMALVYPLG